MKQPLKVIANSGDMQVPVEGDRFILSPELVVLSDPNGTTAEALRHLRTRLIAQHLGRGRRALALCSPSKDSGCSFIAANLAVTFAQVGMRVLLVNADMRGEGADAYFGLSGAQGLLDQIRESARGSDHLAGKEVLENLWFVPSGGPSPDAQEALSSAKFETIFNSSVREFDLTIIDTPPANLYADAQRIAKVAAFAAIVARAHRSYYNDVTELIRQLQADRVTLVGTVLNQH